jgi:hypothetical protein
MKQLHDRICFAPIDWKTLTPEEKKRALESLIFITQKRDGWLKGRHYANGKPQRRWMSREYVSSPTTVSTESTLTARFLQAQWYNWETILYQDNKSSILLEKNGRQSAGKRSRHMDIQYFFITDMVEKGQSKFNIVPQTKWLEIITQNQLLERNLDNLDKQFSMYQR